MRDTSLLLATPVLLALLAAPGHANPLFSAPFLSFDAGLDPDCVAIADLNADGRPDMVVANFRGNTVSVLLGHGDGTFGTKTDFGVGDSPTSVAIADLDADGRADLAVTNSALNHGPDDPHPSTVSVLLGNGDGTFGARTDLATDVLATSVAIADLNADGRLDLAVVNGLYSPWGFFPPPTFTVAVMLGNGDGTFGPGAKFGSGHLAYSVAIADVNADGRPDLAITVARGVQLLLGNGDGTFETGIDFVVEGQPVSVAIGDLNGDGRSDLATANGGEFSPRSSPTISVALGNGDGTFGVATNYDVTHPPGSVAIADLNGDGRPDLAATSFISPYRYSGNNPGQSTVSVLLGDGNGAFGTRTDFIVAGLPLSVAIADLNADGRPDLATANSSPSLSYFLPVLPGTVAVLLGNGDGTFGARTVYDVATLPRSVTIGDLNEDGRPDLVVANTFDRSDRTPPLEGSVSVLLGLEDGTFAAKTDFGTGEYPSSVAIADLNADARPDLAVANFLSNTVSILLGHGDGMFAAKADLGAGESPKSVAIADLNADGRPDLALAGSRLSVMLGNGDGTFAARTEIGPGGNSLAIADLNADGRLDLALEWGAVMLGNGDGTFGARTDFDTGGNSGLAIADLNADGRPDLAVSSTFLDGNGEINLGAVSVVLGNGDGTFGGRTDYAITGGGSSIAVADFDADGRPDLVATNSSEFNDGRRTTAGTVSVLPGNGDGTFGARIDFGTGEFEPVSVAIADFNTDGRPDLAVANSLNEYEEAFLPNKVSVLLNRSTAAVPMTMGFDLKPSTLDLASRGRWVTGFLEPESPFAARDIDVSSIRLNDGVPLDLAGPIAVGDQDGDGIPDLAVKFNRGAVELTLSAGDDVPVTVTGRVGSHSFRGTAHIRVRRAGASAQADTVYVADGWALKLTLEGVRPNPATSGRVAVSFVLPVADPARLELVDVRGRVIAVSEVGSLGAGRHVVDLASGRKLRAGIYLVRLTQGSLQRTARVAVL